MYDNKDAYTKEKTPKSNFFFGLQVLIDPLKYHCAAQQAEVQNKHKNSFIFVFYRDISKWRLSLS